MDKVVDEILDRLAAIEAAVGISRGNELPPANDVRLSKVATARRYGVSPKTIERHVADRTLGFPQPDIVHGRWWFWLSKLQAYDHMRARLPLERRQPPQLTKAAARRRGKETAA